MYSIIEQNNTRDLMLKERLETVLPAVMKETTAPAQTPRGRRKHPVPTLPPIA